MRHEVAWEFPSRERVAASDPAEYPALGFSRRKAEYVVSLARSDLDLDSLAVLPDDDVVETLTAQPGLGRWTADWFLARHLARPGAWPAGDLGVRKAVSAFYAGGRALAIAEVRELGERFAPFQNLSAHFLARGRENGGVSGGRDMTVAGRPRGLRGGGRDVAGVRPRGPPADPRGPADQERELAEVAEILASEVAFVAEQDGSPVGFALARRRTGALATLTDLYVRQDARRSGVATELMRDVLDAVDALGIEHLDLEVMASNAVARSLYARWGFRDEVVVMTQSVADLGARLGRQEAASFGSIHVQSDDLSAVEQAVRQFVPRLPEVLVGRSWRPPATAGPRCTTTSATVIPEMLRRLAREPPTAWGRSSSSSGSNATSSSA